MARLNRSVVLVRSRDRDEKVFVPPGGTIDVWWRGRENGPLMLMLAHLLTKNPEWRRHKIRLLRCVPNEAASTEVHKHLRELADAARIRVDAQTFVTDNAPVTIRVQSARAAVVFLGFAPPEGDEEGETFVTGFDKFLGDLPRVVLVNNAGGVALES